MTGRDSVVLAGPSQLLLIGIKEVLEATDRYKVVSQAHANELAPTLARRLRSDYVILDHTTIVHKNTKERERSIDTLHELVNLSKPPGVLVVVALDQSYLVEELRRAGCRACVSARSPDNVVCALDMLALGREFFPEWRNSRREEHARGNSPPTGLPEGFNRNEVQVLGLMARGHNSKEIAARVGLAVGTVKNYRTSIRAKLGARTHAEIRRAARTAGLLTPPAVQTDPASGGGADSNSGERNVG